MISDINTEYFGKDKRRNYLKHDFRRALEGFIQREVILNVIIESSKKRHYTKEDKNKAGEVVSIAHGDYDPDNAGFLYPIEKNHELGVMIVLRLLFNKKEAGTGGKFVKEVAKLTFKDFLDYYLVGEGKINVPPLLLGEFLEEHSNNTKLKGEDFISKHIDRIEQAVKELVDKAIVFNAKGYSAMIVKEYQALKFHKDLQPEKYDISEQTEKLGVLSLSKTTRKDKSKVETIRISEALNEFAEIIALYQLLVSDSTSFYGSNWPVDTYIHRTFDLFSKNISAATQQKVIDNVVKNLQKSLNLAGWQATK